MRSVPLTSRGLANEHQSLASNSENLEPRPAHDAMLRGLISVESDWGGAVVKILVRVVNPYASTYPSEILTCLFDDGTTRRLLVKRYIPGYHDGHGFWSGGNYEADIYRNVLASIDLGTPRFAGAWPDVESGDVFLALEYVQGLRLDKSPVGSIVDAARWLGRLHQDATPIALDNPSVRRYDEAFFRGWSERALEYTTMSRSDCDWMRPLVRRYQDVELPRLLQAPQVFVHGECYPENVIVDGDRVCTVDWQSAAIGPAGIDLASLTEGSWPEWVIDDCHAAYQRERPLGLASDDAGGDVAAARIHWAFRWLGTSAEDTASHEYDRYLEFLGAIASKFDLGSGL